MTFLFDTDMLNYAVKGNAGVLRRYHEATDAGAVFIICPVVEFEILRYFRLRRMHEYERNLQDFVTEWRRSRFDGDLLRGALPVWVHRNQIGRPIADADLLIAVSAVREGARPVTNNTRHFEGLGLVLENWAA